MRAIAIIFSILFVIGMRPVKGEDDAANTLHGVWRLTSLKLRIVGDESFETDVFGSNPKGISFSQRKGGWRQCSQRQIESRQRTTQTT